MATRSLTEVYILMRNNALQNRHIYSEQVSMVVNHDDRCEMIMMKISLRSQIQNVNVVDVFFAWFFSARLQFMHSSRT